MFIRGIKYQFASLGVLATLLAGCALKPKTQPERPEIKSAILRSLRGFKACYNVERAKDRKLAGTVTLVWEIHKGGLVKKVSVHDETTTLKNRVVQQCMKSEMALMVFPKPTGAMRVDLVQHTFSFPDNGGPVKIKRGVASEKVK